MPQLVKGGKHVFGWSQVSEDGGIRIPPEAFGEYKLTGCDKAICMSGSKRSGGFGLTTVEKLRNSEIGRIIDGLPDLAFYSIPEGEPVRKGSRIYCWINLSPEGYFTVPQDTLKLYGVEPGQRLLVARGS